MNLAVTFRSVKLTVFTEYWKTAAILRRKKSYRILIEGFNSRDIENFHVALDNEFLPSSNPFLKFLEATNEMRQ